MKMERIWGSILLFILISSSAGALEIREGRLKLVMHEKNGRFSVSYLKDIKRHVYEPLFLDIDPRTSLLSILYNNRVLRMGEAADFPLTVEKTLAGAAFVWKSPGFEIRQDFSFVKSKDSSLVDGLGIRLTLKNTGEADCRVGVRYLIDTHLGEASQVHFMTPLKERFSAETSIKPSAEENLFVSADPGDKEGVGLQVMLTGDGITEAEEVVFANWKRLNETAWKYSINPSRNFNLLPYSINDSAACVFYPETNLKPGNTREILTVLGNKSAGKYELTSGSSSAMSVLLRQSAAAEGNGGSDSEESMKADLLRLEDLLRQLNNKLLSNTPVSEEEVHILEQVMDELKRRKAKYE